MSPNAKDSMPMEFRRQQHTKQSSNEVASPSADQDGLSLNITPHRPKGPSAKFHPLLEKCRPTPSPHVAYSDEVIHQRGDLPIRSKTIPAEVSRTYNILRLVNQLELFDRLTGLGFTDHWLPVSSQQLPEFISPKAKHNFLKAQSMILSESTDLEDGEDGRHKSFLKDQPVPFKIVSILGSGSYSQVDKVISKTSNKEYARKLVRRGYAFRQTRGIMKSFSTELEIMKRLNHHHIIRIAGTYSDPNYLGFVMSPVADCNLAAYLSTEYNSDERKARLRTFFGCLITTLAYVHDARIRHKDIKPQNILVKGNSVILTDFGISYSTAEGGHSTTEGAPAMTMRYCAPEVAKYEPRNSSSDIWSLGCVFVEMITVLKNQTITSMRNYFESHGSCGKFFNNNVEAMNDWFLILAAATPSSDNIPLQWARNMVQYNDKLRPKSRALAEIIINHHCSTDFCGGCCLPYV